MTFVRKAGDERGPWFVSPAARCRVTPCRSLLRRWPQPPLDDVLRSLDSSTDGLSSAEASARLIR